MYRLQPHSELLGNMPERSCGSPCGRCQVYAEQRVVVAAAVAYLQWAESALWRNIEHWAALAEAAHSLQQDVVQPEEQRRVGLLPLGPALFALAPQLLSSVLAVLRVSAPVQQVAA